MTSRNEQLFAEAQRHIPGGVNSPVRAFRGVGGTPRFFVSGKGPRVTDADGKVYLDYVGSWGPLILGHADPDVLEAVQTTAARGLTFGAPTGAEVEMADLLCELLPSLEMVRLVSSGTEATMSAIRLARGFTGRDLIIKFEGCYHGHADSLLVKAGSGLLTFGNPSSGGVPADVAAHTLVLPYNDIAAFNEALDKYADKLAAVIVEPIAGNMNLVDPGKAFLQALRDGCTRVGAVLIFDEVMTGFRVGLQGVQGHYGITPDRARGPGPGRLARPPRGGGAALWLGHTAGALLLGYGRAHDGHDPGVAPELAGRTVVLSVRLGAHHLGHHLHHLAPDRHPTRHDRPGHLHQHRGQYGRAPAGGGAGRCTGEFLSGLGEPVVRGPGFWPAGRDHQCLQDAYTAPTARTADRLSARIERAA